MLVTIQTEVQRQLLTKSTVVSNSVNDLLTLDTLYNNTMYSPPLPSSSTNQHPLTSSTTKSSNEVAVLLSGGVDSSVALALLQQQGYNVTAYYLKIWLEDEIAHLNQCPWEEDLSYAQSVCDQLNITLHTISLQSEYWQYVVEYTLAEAKQGRTPNPDIMCNSRIKFGMFYDYVGKYYWKVATGHYAQVRPKHPPTHTPTLTPTLSTSAITEKGHNSDLKNEGHNSYPEVELYSSPDPVKDQTYFLCNLRQDQLKKAMFPIGHLQKAQVRVRCLYILYTTTRIRIL